MIPASAQNPVIKRKQKPEPDGDRMTSESRKMLPAAAAAARIGAAFLISHVNLSLSMAEQE